MPVERWTDDRLDNLATTAASLLETVIIHQRNFEAIMAKMERMHSEIRGLQTENRRILDILSRQQGD